MVWLSSTGRQLLDLTEKPPLRYTPTATAYEKLFKDMLLISGTIKGKRLLGLYQQFPHQSLTLASRMDLEYGKV